VRRSSVVIRFELGRVLRDRMTWIVLLLFTLVAGIGAFTYWSALPPRPMGSRMLGDAYAYALMLGFHTGIGTDRMAGFDRYLTCNFVSAGELFFGKVCSAVVSLTGFAFFAFVIGTTMALGDAEFVAQQILRYFALSILIVPGVLLTEIFVPSRFPTLILTALTFLSLLFASALGDRKQFISLIGVDASYAPGEFLLRLAVAAVLIALSYPLYRFRFARVSRARH
jgi:cellulose synthase/poly-beta-1,6-N-acetylglucosamine synthase-like glycosyltransferase